MPGTQRRRGDQDNLSKDHARQLFLPPLRPSDDLWPVAYRGGGLRCWNPPPAIPKALENRAKLNPIVKTVKNC
jgi:hypothetical protein